MLKSLLNLLQYCFPYVLVVWSQGMWDLSSPVRDGTQPPALEGKVLTTRPPGESVASLLTLGALTLGEANCLIMSNTMETPTW